jgi:rSAM/selenodomain-associated transferase 1
VSAGAIVVFAKLPRPGQVKTRMVPPLTGEQALGLYTALLRDVLEATAAFSASLDLEPFLAVHPREGAPALAREAPPAFRVVAQRGADLSQRMSWALREVAAGGVRRVLLRGSDSPVLDEALVAEALASLERAELCVSPDRDGGYNLIGLRRPLPGLFDHPMSTGSVLEDTLTRAAEVGVSSTTLGPSFDLDRVEDLRDLARARRLGVTGMCQRTLAYLDEQRLWRFAGAG